MKISGNSQFLMAAVVICIFGCWYHQGTKTSNAVSDMTERSSTTIDDEISLVGSLTTPWQERIAAENALKVRAAKQVLRKLLPLIAEGWPNTGFFHSSGQNSELVTAPVGWQRYYVILRLWEYLLYPLAPHERSELLLTLYRDSQSPSEHKVLFRYIVEYWSSDVEKLCMQTLLDKKAQTDTRRTAALEILEHHSKKYWHRVAEIARNEDFEAKIEILDAMLLRINKSSRKQRRDILEISFQVFKKKLPDGLPLLNKDFIQEYVISEKIQIAADLQHTFDIKLFPDQAAPEFRGEAGQARYYDTAIENTKKWLRKQLTSHGQAL